MYHINHLKRTLSLLLVCAILCSLINLPSAQASIRQAEPGEWFYNQLSDANKEAYDAIKDQVSKLEQSSTNPSSVSFTPSSGDPTDAAIFAFFRDHPEYFWVDSSKLVWGVDNNNVWSLYSKVTGESFFYEGFDVSTLSNVRNQFNTKVEGVIAGMPSGDLVSKLRYLNNWIAQNNVYNPSGLSASNYSRCAASGILSNNDENTAPVCYGYATALKVLLDAANITNAYIEGFAYNDKNMPHGEQHAWNYVEVDGSWYAIDPTWDDPKLATAPARFHYFLVGSKTVTETSLIGKEEFGQNHDSSAGKTPASDHNLSYPPLSATASDQVVTTGFELIQGGTSTKYTTLEEALNAAKTGGGTIKMWEPVTNLSNTLTIPDGVTLDLNGQNSTVTTSDPTAISGTISPLLEIDTNSEVSIINSSSFTGIKTDSSSACIQNDGTLTLGTNIKIAREKPLMGGDPLTSPIGGITPQYASHSYVNSGLPDRLFVYLAIQPTVTSASGEYPADGGETVGDLTQWLNDNKNSPSLNIQYYNTNGVPQNVPSTLIPSYEWSADRSPNNGDNVQPSDLLENGDYLFVTTIFGYPVTYTVMVSGVPITPSQYTVSVIGGDGATGAGTYQQGAQVTVTAGTKQGHTFQSWTAKGVTLSNDTQSTISFVMPGNDVTLTANFLPDTPVTPQYTVTVIGGDGATGAGTYQQGTQVTVTAGTKQGHTFQSWTAKGVTLSNDTQSTISFVMPGNDVTLTAGWMVYNPGGSTGGGGGSSSGGSSTSGNKTETVTNPDGSTTTTTTVNGTTTETTKYPDGSKEVVETTKDGTVTTTTTDPKGNKTEVVEKPDGSSQTTVDNKDGSGSVTVVDESGKVTSSVTASEDAVDAAREEDEAVALPMPNLPNTSDRETAPTVTVSLPERSESTKVEIPVQNVTPGTVAVIVKPDGTEEVVKTSLTTENSVIVTLSDGDTVKIVDNTKSFTDVSDSYWGAAGIAFATSRELFNGTGKTTFSPDVSMSRGMIVTVLARLEGVDSTVGSTWYEAGQQWAMENGISNGNDMEQNLTREQLATMLYRYAKTKGYHTTQSGMAIQAYADFEQISDYAVEAMAWAVEMGLISGTDNVTLNPQAPATRAQVATILMRFCENM